MRLYSRTGATAVDDPEYGRFEPDETGSFDFPDEVSDRLRRFHHGKQPLWEDAIERQERHLAEQMEQAQNPATLLAMVAQLTQAVTTLAPAAQAQAQAQAETAAGPKRGTGKRTTPPAE